MTKYLIREARKEDAEKILRYTKIVGAQTNNLTFGGEGIDLTIEEEENILEHISNSDKSIFLIVCLEDEIIGVGNISAKSSKRTKHKAMVGITVKKKYWRMGIGSKLMESLIEFAKEAKLEIIELNVRSDNQGAIHLYEKFGFIKTGVFPADFKINGKYYDSDYMILDLRKNNKKYEKR